MARSGAQRLLWLRAVAERLGQSLFFLPAVMVLGSVALAELGQLVDQWFDEGVLGGRFDTTVDGARAVLSTIAGATITAASVVLSLTLVAVQLSSSQYSPRSLGNFLGDRIQQVVIGSVLGTFTYSMLVLREVRGPIDSDGDAVVPLISVGVAVALALGSLIALIASINHTAQTLRVENVLDRTSTRTIGAVRTRLAEPGGTGDEQRAPDEIGEGEFFSHGPSGVAYVAAPRSGWVQQISEEAMAAAVPPGSVLRLAVAPGHHVLEGTPMVYVRPLPPDIEAVRVEVLRSLVIGSRRTLQQDIGFGILQLEDVALRALSPSVNDPNTAVDVVNRMGSVLLEIMSRAEFPRAADMDGRTLVRAEEPDHERYVQAALDGIRRHGAAEPRVLTAIVHMIGDLRGELSRRRPGADLGCLDAQLAAVEAVAATLPFGERHEVELALVSIARRDDGIGVDVAGEA